MVLHVHSLPHLQRKLRDQRKRVSQQNAADARSCQPRLHGICVHVGIVSFSCPRDEFRKLAAPTDGAFHGFGHGEKALPDAGGAGYRCWREGSGVA